MKFMGEYLISMVGFCTFALASGDSGQSDFIPRPIPRFSMLHAGNGPGDEATSTNMY